MALLSMWDSKMEKKQTPKLKTSEEAVSRFEQTTFMSPPGDNEVRTLECEHAIFAIKAAELYHGTLQKYAPR